MNQKKGSFNDINPKKRRAISTSISMDELKMSKMVKNRPLTKNIWNEWFDLLIGNIPEPVKMFVSFFKEKNMKLFEIDTDNIIENITDNETDTTINRDSTKNIDNIVDNSIGNIDDI